VSNTPDKPPASASTSRVRSHREKLKASGRQRLEISLSEPVYAALQSLAVREGTSVAAVAEALVTGYALPAVAKELPPHTEARALVRAALKPARINPMAEFLGKRALSQRPPSKPNRQED
jgi:hypothetical protein